MDKFDIAFDLMFEGHKGQYRKGFRIPYAAHPMDVLKRLYMWGVTDEDTLLAAICHDLLEDTEITYEDIGDKLGFNVADIVLELTFYQFYHINKNAYMESFIDKSVESLVIKLADRACNVYDFLDNSDSYGYKYAKKAAPLYDAVNIRVPEIKEKYGSYTYLKISREVENLRTF